jgi:hypothetical protein
MDKINKNEKSSRSGISRFIKFALIILCIVALLIVGWVKYNIYASKFTPVQLRQDEQEVLESKLALLKESEYSPSPGKRAPAKPLTPEPYTEKGASREISLTERELNGLIANKPEIAERVAIDLSDDLVSVKLVVPVDEEVPVLGGKTLKFHMGLIMSYEKNRPIVALKGISLGGIPMPNAWLGYMKNKNMIDEFGSESGFWKIFSEGVEDIRVQDGHIRITLKE